MLARPAPADFLLLTDADIAYAPETVTGLVAEAAAEGLVLNSRMAKLTCANPAERALIPAFIFFFQMLYPFAWVNRPARPIAAAAGGCMLARREALLAAGGIESIRGELIDDCALARRLKARGPIRLDLDRAGAEPPALCRDRRDPAHGRPLGLCPAPLLALAARRHGAGHGRHISGAAAPRLLRQRLAAGAWRPGLAMALPSSRRLRFYRLSPLWGLALPAIAALYLLFTLDSAWQHWRGRGGFWKGRAQAPGSEAA